MVQIIYQHKVRARCMQILDGKAGGTKKREGEREREKRNHSKATPMHGCAKSPRNTNNATHAETDLQ